MSATSHSSARPRRYRDIEKKTLDSSASSSASASESEIPLPPSSYTHTHKKRNRWAKKNASGLGNILALFGVLWVFTKLAGIGGGFEFPFTRPTPDPKPLPKFVEDGIRQCEIINRPKPHFPPSTNKRKYNDRHVPGSASIWLKNGTLWTGEEGGTEILKGVDVLLQDGLIRRIGTSKDLAEYINGNGKDVEEVQLHGAWVTPGIVDMHSHIAIDSAPSIFGAEDTNSIKGSVQPWLRSLDGLNTHDLAFNGTIAGGVTTMLVLPGSAGEAFPIKPRWTYENTPQSLLVEPAWKIDNGTWARTHAWRHIKHACGENPKRVYGQTRMDNAYDFRRAYTEGATLKEKQDRWCTSPSTQTEPFPTSLEWEVLSDVIRGNVKVNVHCYETTDLNALVRISNEFQFPIAAFHHAHETYLVPDLLKQAYGEPPSVAIFSTNARYKREAYRGSEFAAKALSEEGLKVVMKSDHPVLDSRYLITEASWIHHYGVNVSEALNSVTTNPARSVGLDHRVGYLREGYDADLVVWDSFPLNLGATPKQTYIDGIPQIVKPVTHDKPVAAQEVPTKQIDWEKEIQEALNTRGEPDLRPAKSVKNVIYQNVGEFHLQADELAIQLQEVDLASFDNGKGVVVVQDGQITCAGSCSATAQEALKGGFEFEIVNLHGGVMTPSFITVGSYVGLLEIRQEKATSDGAAMDPLSEESEITNGLLAHAVDGAQFGGKDELLAYKSGVTTAVIAPKGSSWISGISYSFSPEAEHLLSKGAIQNKANALWIKLDNSKISTSSKIAILRKLLSGSHSHHVDMAEGIKEEEEETELVSAFKKVSKGELRLVVKTDKADHIASLIRVKEEVAKDAKITILGGQESWIVADELAASDIGVIVAPVRSYPGEWDTRRIIPSIPLSNHTLPSYLASHGVTVGLGIQEEWQARNTLYEAAWTYANSPSGVFSKRDALDLVGKNLEILLGLDDSSKTTVGAGAGWVAHQGNPFEFGSKVVSVKGHGEEKSIDLF
uniref:Amidohydrolase n=1 Tax=Kwoniella dejecticola CBS 10117 TaxID=1296121 RepID=A0A1A6A070_9TREE|nr:amidohydrolase [Kwoniella dejecticola CBS 10117]OBR83458.1 amidohydrolase [Kwoniella dejecticola CBS 10117]